MKRILPILLLVCARSVVIGQTVSYEADVFPEVDGWTRSDRLFLADRHLDDGRLVQHAEAVEFDPPLLDEDEDDFYTKSLVAFAGVDAFFLEWRMETDGPREGFPNVSPAALVAGGNLGVNYHFTIARDQVLFIQDPLLPLVFVDTEPSVPHVYRLELFGTAFYRWLIDGQVVFHGIPEGPYPTADSVVVFGARAAGQPITARWDYIRFGVIPEEGSGDFDSDGLVTDNDFFFFQECLTNQRPGINGGPDRDAGPGCRFADFDFDNDTDLFDFAEFQNLFTITQP